MSEEAMNYKPQIEIAARALCASRNTAQCAAICLSRFAFQNFNGKCPDAINVFREDAEAVVNALVKEGYTF